MIAYYPKKPIVSELERLKKESNARGNGTECKCGRSVATIVLCDRGHSYCDSCWHEYEGLFGWYEATEWYAETPCPECVMEDFGGGEVLRLTNPQEDLFYYE